jgi:hypothetical protein
MVLKNMAPYADSGLAAEKAIDRIYRPLAQSDITALEKKYSIPRKIIHKLYGQYKSLLTIAA